jgi:hypothetical protein
MPLELPLSLKHVIYNLFSKALSISRSTRKMYKNSQITYRMQLKDGRVKYKINLAIGLSQETIRQ